MSDIDRIRRPEERVVQVAAPELAALPAEPGVGRPSIAVLPFANMSGDAEQEYFADGMVEDIITGLSRIRWLDVIARNSSFIYKGKAVDIRAVGRELNVRYVLEGSVRKLGPRVRITGQLIETDSGAHIWADKFDGELEKLFDILDDVTAAVVGAIEPNLRNAEIERAKRKRADNLDAYDLYLRAYASGITLSFDGWAEALHLLDRCLAIDPDYPEAHGLAAWSHYTRFVQYGEAGREAALKHADIVRSSRTEDATTLSFAATPIALLAGECDIALGMVDRALTFNPSCAHPHHVAAVVCGRLGQYERSIAHAQRAIRLSPFDHWRAASETAIGIAKFMNGEYEAALPILRGGLQHNPRFGTTHYFIIAGLIRLGRVGEATAAARRLLEVEPHFRILDMLQRRVSRSGDHFEAIVPDLHAAGLPE